MFKESEDVHLGFAADATQIGYQLSTQTRHIAVRAGDRLASTVQQVSERRKAIHPLRRQLDHAGTE
jgi:hypothetical protein